MPERAAPEQARRQRADVYFMLPPRMF